MTGERASSKGCPVCGGAMHRGEATIPYVLRENVVVVVKNVPAEICDDCREAFTAGAVTDHVTALLRQLKSVPGEVSVVSYSEYEPA